MSAKFVYTPEDDQSFSDDRCFLCGVALSDSNRTDEHVFSKWVQNRCNLWNERVNLLNGTTMPYRQLKIPCCDPCNGTHLSQVESTVRDAFALGVDAVRQVDRRTLFFWLAKIYYGLMFRELLLPVDRTSPTSGTILTRDVLESFRMHHTLLQGVRGVVRWRHPEQQPASIFVFECQTVPSVQCNFDYFDILSFPYLGIRVGSTAVISVLQDWGALECAASVPMIEVAKTISLHPLQFRQLAAFGAYSTYLFNRVPKHVIRTADEYLEVITLPLAGLSGSNLFDSHELDVLASILAHAWAVPKSQIFDGVRLVDLIEDGRGGAQYLQWEENVDLIPSLK